MSYKKNKRRRHNSSEQEESIGDATDEEPSSATLTNEEKEALKRLKMTINMIRVLPVKDFNDMVRGKSKEDSKVAKALRRKLKNRGYAADCRNKREERLMHLKMKKECLQRQIEEDERNLGNIKRVKEELKWKCDLMESILGSGRTLTCLPSGQIIPDPI